MDVWVTFEVGHTRLRGESVDSVQEHQCLMAQVRDGEQEEEPPEKDEENQVSAEGLGSWQTEDWRLLSDGQMA